MEPEREREEEPAIESPPEGSTCAEHSDRPALVICPRCGSFACLSCWHGALRRCHACVVRHPAPAVPWEDPSRGLISRFVGTIGDAGSPVLTAPSFRADGTGRALLFFLLTFVPFAAISGIVPYTAHLLFGSSFSVQTQGDPTDEAIAYDVARAAGLGVIVGLGQWLALALPFVSLSNAFAEKGHPDAPMRAMLYRGWLLALFFLAQWAVPLAMPGGAGGAGALFAMLVSMVPFVLLLSTMRATTRMGSGVGALTALLTIAVPFAMMVGASYFLERGVRVVVPELGQLEEQQRVEAEREAAREGQHDPSSTTPPTGEAPAPSPAPPTIEAPSAPEAPAPTEGAPSEAAPSEAAPSEAAPSEAAPSEAAPPEVAPAEPAPATATP